MLSEMFIQAGATSDYVTISRAQGHPDMNLLEKMMLGSHPKQPAASHLAEKVVFGETNSSSSREPCQTTAFAMGKF